MTMTTEPTKTPEVPSWLNLDGYCPPEAREALNAASDALEALIAYAEPIVRQAYEAVRQYERSTSSSHIEDEAQVFGPYTGFTRFEALRGQFEALAHAAGAEIAYGDADVVPDWYVGYSREPHAPGETQVS